MHERATPPLTAVHLHGPLAAKYGKVHHLAVTSPAEAIRALCSQKAGFKADFSAPGASYTVLLGKAELPLAGLNLYAAEPIHIVPVVEGNKSEFGQILAGAALIVASDYTFGASGWAVKLGMGAKTAGAMGTLFTSMGASMVVGGISQMLSPAPTVKGQGSMEGPKSHLFNGPANTVGQGTGIPILYGELTDVGSHVIGALIDSVDPNMAASSVASGVGVNSMITMADGSLKRAGDITADDLIMVLTDDTASPSMISP